MFYFQFTGKKDFLIEMTIVAFKNSGKEIILHCTVTLHHENTLFSRGHATLELAVSVGRLVRFLIREWFSHYRSCPTVRDWIAVYPVLLKIT